VHESESQDVDDDTDPSALALLDVLLESVSLRDAARIAAKVTGQPRDALYALALARQKSALG
jgi:16S rRNA (cytidine1402-2'-O)-methyltransferase